jgi:hypothetical protein
MILLSPTVTRKWVIYTGFLCCLEEAIIWNSVLNMFNRWWTKKYQKFIKPFYWNFLKQRYFFYTFSGSFIHVSQNQMYGKTEMKAIVIGHFTALCTIWKYIVLVRIVLKTRIGRDAANLFIIQLKWSIL